MQKDCRNNPCQRFGASLNSILHYHCAVIDGVFSERDGALYFHPASVLSEVDVAALERADRPS